MGDDKKKKGSSKAGLLLVVLLAAIVGVGVLGWLRPETPYIGPLVASIFKQAAAVGNGEGTYSVKIGELRFADAEFNEGENLDLQVVIFRIDADGKRVGEAIYDTSKYGERLVQAGSKEKPPVARWPDNAVSIDWKRGQEFLIEVWDKKGSDTLLVERRTEKSTGFPLSGQITFAQVDGHDSRDPKGNYIKFDAVATTGK
jgi:hypothetical protein